MKKIIILFIFFISVNVLAVAQSTNENHATIDSIYQELLVGNSFHVEYSTLLNETIKKYNETDLLEQLEKYKKQDGNNIKHLLFNVWNAIFYKTEEMVLKQAMLENITSFCLLKYQYGRITHHLFLQKIPSVYYNDKAKKNIQDALEKYQHSELMLLAATLETDGLADFLKDFFKKQNPPSYKTAWDTQYWQARLAFARLGDKESIDFYMEKFKNYDVQRPGFSNISAKMGYMRQPETIELLKELLMSDKNLKPKYFRNGHGVAFYALYQLTQGIEDFPIPYENKGPFYTLEELEIARNWAKNDMPYKIRK
ncbi:MAG: hypothetical protein ACPG5B_03880 [Chitinophagales bacterium]